MSTAGANSLVLILEPFGLLANVLTPPERTHQTDKQGTEECQSFSEKIFGPLHVGSITSLMVTRYARGAIPIEKGVRCNVFQRQFCGGCSHRVKYPKKGSAGLGRGHSGAGSSLLAEEIVSVGNPAEHLLNQLGEALAARLPGQLTRNGC